MNKLHRFLAVMALTQPVLFLFANAQSSLVGYYPFNGNANDESGNGNNGLVSGATLTADRFGNSNKAYSFNGNGGKISIANTTSLNPPELTISAWIYYQGGTENPRIFSKGITSSFEFWIQGGNGLLSAHVNGVAYQSDDVVPQDKWVHVALVKSLSNLEFYVNGNRVHSFAAAGALTSSSTNLIVGDRTDSYGTDRFKGSVDEVFIYGRALSANEISAMGSVLAYYPFNGNANDESGNSNNGVVAGATLTADRFGNANKAYFLNGGGGKISISNTSFLNPPELTISAWIYYQGGTENPRIFSKGITSSFELWIQGGNGLLSAHVNGVAYQSNDVVPRNSWVHVAMVKSLTSLEFYINGQLVHTFASSGALTSSSTNLVIGDRTDNYGTDRFGGSVDEVFIYGRALSTVTSVDINRASSPTRFAIQQNYPNPFNPSTTIVYQVPQRATVNIKVYNSLGQLVKTLLGDEQTAGNYTITWDGRNDAGSAVSSGAYFYQIKVGEFVQTRQMLLVK